MFYSSLEACVVVLLVLSGLYDCVFFSRAILSQPKVKLTPAQRKLLRVKEKGTGNHGNLTSTTRDVIFVLMLSFR